MAYCNFRGLRPTIIVSFPNLENFTRNPMDISCTFEILLICLFDLFEEMDRTSRELGRTGK